MIETTAYKVRLEAELTNLLKELSSIGIHNPEVPEDWIAIPATADSSEADPNDVADRTEDWVEKQAEMELLEARYNNVTRALKKIEEGRFGMCEVSGEPIEPERLDANPAARTCIAHLEDERTLPL